MKPTKILILLLTILTIGCNNKPKEKVKNYELINEDGISVEKFDSTNTDQNRYTENNLTFKSGNSFTYDYEHISATNEKMFFEWDESKEGYRNKWNFVSEDSINDDTILKIVISVQKGLEPMISNIPDYNQTVIKFEYKLADRNAPFSSSSGVIENEANIWMHPPRDQYFSILELNPFPFIKAPYEIGNEWNWSLTIGDGWSDKRWKEWDGRIENKYTYKITGRKTLETELGEIDCWVVEGNAVSRIGETKLKAFFNSKYGFVKLNYTNIDGSSTNLVLSDYSEV
jgi:hypothetical protein